ncbi:hypothetical protein BB560_006111 [Smittium megazygosporum]|uniref:Thioredoxin domain-containing protein n=1 Tax=Smittium megazygosporum TaxID=133381 RepID=A0A2T9YGY4_9FUNG|nr:hypothetical protein BB560_006111 [Smittium megazygosporum]
MNFKFVLSLLLLLLVVPVSGHSFDNDKHVKELTPKKFKRYVHDSNYPVCVMFYAPWCGYCKQLTPIYKKTAKSAKAFGRFHAVNCDESENRPLCSKYGVEGFPTLKFFKNSKDSSGEKIAYDFLLDRTSKNLLSEIKKNLLRLTQVVRGDMSDLDKFLKREKQAKAILFTDKSSTPDLWKGLAVGFHKKIILGAVNSRNKDIFSYYKIESTPQILVFHPDENNEFSVDSFTKYKGPTKYEEIVEFLKPFKISSQKSKPSKSSSKKSPKKPSATKSSKLRDEL